jgi:hypothetical protein
MRNRLPHVRSPACHLLVATVMLLGFPVFGIDRAMIGLANAQTSECRLNDPYCPHQDPDPIQCVKGVCFDKRDLGDVWDAIVDYFTDEQCVNPGDCRSGPGNPANQCHSGSCAKKRK